MSMDKRYKCFFAGLVVGVLTWSISLYMYFVLNSVNIVIQGTPQPQSPYVHDVVIPYEEGMDSNKGKEKYLLKETNGGVGMEDIARQKLDPILTNDIGFDDPGRVKNLADLSFRDEGYKNHGFNALVSRNLDYHRFIPDSRHKLCKTQNYPNNLPSVSVIICFYNEQFDTLVRSLHSVIDRTPESLLKEIILVDDFSEAKGLHDSVAKYIETTMLRSVKFYRTAQREGLIRARIFGAGQASGDVLMFLDSHIEANVGWLEPLLARIKLNETRVVTPVIDIINADTFEYKASPLVRGGLNWGLHFKWINVPNEQLKTDEDFIKPITSPTMAGGLFAMSKKYFDGLGKYDPGMNIWGGENIEISFRIWMCGGSIEIIPCSRIGHVFRKHRPYSSPNGEDTMLRNSLRVANVWMDEYKERFYKQRPEVGNLLYGDISSRIDLRKRLNCKPFSWYVEHVYPELLQPGHGDDAVGSKMDLHQRANKGKKSVGTYQIRLSGTSLCIASEKDVKTKGSKLLLKSCLRVKNQLWTETSRGELKLAHYLCMDVHKDDPVLGKCHEMGGSQEWRHKSSNNMAVYSPAGGTCLSAVEIAPNSRVTLSICNANNRSQWDFVPVFM